MSASALHPSAPTHRMSATGLAGVLAAHGLLAVLLVHAESWTPPTREHVLGVTLLPVVQTEALKPEAAQKTPPTPPPTIVPTPRTQITVPVDVATATPVETPPPPVEAAPLAPTPTPAIDPAPAPQAPAATPSPVPPVTPARFDADYLDNPKPGYPPISRRLGEEGRVVLRVRVDAAGRPAEAQIHASSGSDRLDQAALTTVLRWKFVPARRGSEAIAATVLVPITFSLKG